MKKERKEIFLKAGLSIAAAAVAAAINPVTVVDSVGSGLKFILSSVAPGWAAQFSAEAFMPWIKKNWLSHPDPKVNHHINTTLLNSWKLTLEQIRTEYLQRHAPISGKEDTAIDAFLGELIAQSGEQFLVQLTEQLNKEEIFSYLSPAQDEVRNYLDKRFQLTRKLDPFSDDYYLTNTFIEFLWERLPSLFCFHFRENLKEGTEAKQAMDLLYFDTINATVSILAENQTRQLAILQDIREKIMPHPGFEQTEKKWIADATQGLVFRIYEELSQLRKQNSTIIKILNDPLLSDNDESDTYDPATLLSYKQRYSDFIGRDEDVRFLNSFIQSGELFSWVALTAAGGTGKSRLAQEFNTLAREQGFNAGFFNVRNYFNWESWYPVTPTLLVIDYAFAAFETVFGIIETLRKKARQNHFAVKIRILLLDRVFSEHIQSALTSRVEVRNSSFLREKTQYVRELQSLDDPDNHKLFEQVVMKSDLSDADKQNILSDFYADPSILETFDRKKRVLHTFLLATMACLPEDPFADNTDTSNQFDNYLNRLETNVWAKIPGFRTHRTAIKKLLLVNTICRTLDLPQLYKVADRLQIPFEFIEQEYSMLVEVEKDAAGTITLWYGIQPDLIGEYFILDNTNEITADPLHGQLAWLRLKDLCIEIDASHVAETFRMIENDFQLKFTLLPEDVRQYIDVYDSLIAQYPGNYVHYSERGSHKYNHKLFSESLTDFEEAIALNPHISYLYNMRGLSKWQLKRTEDALADFEKAIDLSPEIATYYNNKGFQLYLLKRYEEALTFYEMALERNDKDPMPWGNKGSVLYELKQIDEAVVCLEKSIALGSRDHGVYEDLGHARFVQERYEEAIACYLQAQELDGNKFRFSSSLANAYYYHGEFEKALVCSQDALERNNGDTYARQIRGYTYRSLGRYQDALDDLLPILADLAETAFLFYNIGCSYLCLKNYTAAVPFYETTVRLEPGSYVYHAEYAVTLGMTGQADKGLVEINIAAGIKQDDSSLYAIRSKINHSLKNYPAALHDCEQALQLDPRNPNALKSKGDILCTLERYPEAIATYGLSLDLNPDSAVYAARASAYANSGDHALAISDFDEVLAMHPQNLPAHYFKAMSLLNLERLDEAYAITETILSINPKDSQAFNIRGMISSNRSDFQKAISHFSMSLQLGNHNAAANLETCIDAEMENSLALFNASEPAYTTDLAKAGIRFFDASLAWDLHIRKSENELNKSIIAIILVAHKLAGNEASEYYDAETSARARSFSSYIGSSLFHVLHKDCYAELLDLVDSLDKSPVKDFLHPLLLLAGSFMEYASDDTIADDLLQIEPVGANLEQLRKHIRLFGLRIPGPNVVTQGYRFQLAASNLNNLHLQTQLTRDGFDYLSVKSLLKQLLIPYVHLYINNLYQQVFTGLLSPREVELIVDREHFHDFLISTLCSTYLTCSLHPLTRNGAA